MHETIRGFQGLRADDWNLTLSYIRSESITQNKKRRRRTVSSFLNYNKL
jgi:hypothetical protein